MNLKTLSLTLSALFSASPAFAQAVLKPSESAAAPEDKPSPFNHEAQVNFSGMLNQGNISLISGKTQGYYQLRYLRHSLRFEGALGIAGQAQDTDNNPATGFETALQDNINTVASRMPSLLSAAGLKRACSNGASTSGKMLGSSSTVWLSVRISSRETV